MVTHRPPERQHPPVYTFVTDGVEAAITQAKAVAYDRAVGLHGATVMQQVLPLGLVDEFRRYVIAVLVGYGTQLSAGLARASSLQRTDVVAMPGATRLRFSV